MQRDKQQQTEQQQILLAEGTHSDDGVDLTLIRWMLSLSPAERLQVLQQTVWSILDLRGD